MAGARKSKLKPGDHVVTNGKYADIIIGCREVPYEGTLVRPVTWREGLWSVRMHHPVLGIRPQHIHESLMEKWSEEHMGLMTNETVKLSGFTWIKTDRNTWVTDAPPKGEDTVARIRFLDAKTWCVYRDRKYLGSEPTLEAAAARAKANKLSERNLAKAAAPVRSDKEVRAKVHAEVASKRTQAKREPRDGNRNAEILTLLKRGCTSEEVLRVTGWKAISMPAMAKSLDVGLRIDKSTKPFTYYATEEK